MLYTVTQKVHIFLEERKRKAAAAGEGAEEADGAQTADQGESNLATDVSAGAPADAATEDVEVKLVPTPPQTPKDSSRPSSSRKVISPKPDATEDKASTQPSGKQ